MWERQKQRDAEKREDEERAYRGTKAKGRQLAGTQLSHTQGSDTRLYTDRRPTEDRAKMISGRGLGAGVCVRVFVWKCVWWVKGTAGSLYHSAFGSLAALQSWASPGKLEIPPKELWGLLWIAEWSHLLSFCLRCFSPMGQPGVMAPKMSYWV